MRWRNMYYLTGQPGWMRFGYSPGWVGRSATGLGPCAQFLLTGRWPWYPGAGQAQFAQVAPWGIDLLKAQAEALRQQLSLIEERIRQLEQEASERKASG